MAAGRLLPFSLIFPLLLLCGALPLRAEQIPHHGESVNPRGSSEECLACHDGLIAGNVPVCTVDCSFNSAHPLSHRYPPRGKEGSFRPADSLKEAGIELVDGKVACISCHNLGNPGKGHLVMDNAGSRLCAACHVK